MSRVNQHDFSRVPSVETERSVLNRSHTHRTTFQSSYLIPFFVDEILPGDTISLRHSVFIRMLQALDVPIMDNLYFDTFYFFVPNRLVWDNWQRFCGERPDPDSTIDFSVPQKRYGPTQEPPRHGVADYFGCPVAPQVAIGQGEVYELNALPFRAYALIYNEWFRDQNIIDSVVIPKGDGPDTGADISSANYGYLRRRGKRHDYFTSCLPWPQKGDDIEIPLGSTAPVIGDGKALGLRAVYGGNDHPIGLGWLSTGLEATSAALGLNVGDAYNPGTQPDTGKAIGLDVVASNTHVYADLSTAVAATVNEWRYAIALQRFQEREARGGSRYTEILRSFWKVISPDQRLQRPEYLGGSSDPIHVSQVHQTAPSATAAVGKLAAYVYGGSQKHGFNKSFVEHGYVIGICNVRADLTYQQGVPRMFSRQTRYDFFWPVLAHLGEQEVLNKEIFYSNVQAGNNLVFGYQGRYDEYRYKPSMITGQLRSTADHSLDVWHLSQEFGACPQLNQEFIEEAVPMARVKAITDPDTADADWLMDAYFQYKHTRVMPTYGVPGFMDHF